MELYDKLVSDHIIHQQEVLKDTAFEEMREEALKVFEAQGFPTIKLEDWRYTNLKPLVNKKYSLFPDAESGVDYKDVKQYFIHDIESYRIVFINGVYSSFLSKTTHEEADICVLSSTSGKGIYKSVFENYFNKIVDAEDAMVALNTAYSKDGAYIIIPENVILSKPIQVIYFSTTEEEATLYNPRNLIVVGDKSKVEIIERHQTLNGKNNLTNSVTEIHVGKNAHVDYYKIQDDDKASSIIDSTFVHQEKDSFASVQTYSFGGKFTRNGLTFKQFGSNCNSTMGGVTIGHDDQHIDHHTLVEHKSPNCESHELYRMILDDNSRGVFNGKVIVDKIAQKINAYQQNNNILLSDNARIDSKPQLEIFADDVKCSHGCTVGQLDEDALFYMQTRGIPIKAAKALLLYAFCADALENVKISQIEDRLRKLIAKKLDIEI